MNDDATATRWRSGGMGIMTNGVLGVGDKT